jgi:hypothetical protein
MKYVREIFDMIFSVYTFILLIMVGFFYLILQINEVEELRQKEAAYCYSQNMVVVETDAGRRCTPASSLVVIK